MSIKGEGKSYFTLPLTLQEKLRTNKNFYYMATIVCALGLADERALFL